MVGDVYGRYAGRGLNSFSIPEKHEKNNPGLSRLHALTLYHTYVNSTWA